MGLSCKWADALKARLAVADLTCNVMMERDYRRNALEKLVWISSFMLIGQVHGGINVGEVANKHFDEVEEMVVEMAGMMRSTIAVSFKPEMPERLCAYAQTGAPHLAATTQVASARLAGYLRR